MKKKLVAGFDPGGQNRFGWSLLEVSDGLPTVIKAEVSYNAFEAMETIKKEIDKTQIVAAGIDGPLYWSQKSNSRCVDTLLRDKLGNIGKAKSSVIEVNSLRGACLVQSSLIMKFVLEYNNDIKITETHPKVLLHFLNLNKNAKLSSLKNFIDGIESVKDFYKKNENIRDAILSGLCACAMVSRDKNWEDLMERGETINESKFFPAGNASYYMPKNVLVKFI